MDNTNNYSVSLSRPVLKFLQESVPSDSDRSSKLDAFIHLLESAAESSGSGTMDGSGTILPKGRFMTSFSELAEAWNWHRGNVRMFMQSLVNLGAITMERTGKRLLVSLPLLLEDDTTPVRLPDEEERAWLRFILGISTVDEFFSLFDAAMNEAETGLSEISGDGKDIAAVGERLRRLLDHLLLHAANIPNPGRELHEALGNIFVNDCRSDLKLFLAVLSFDSISALGFSPCDHPLSRLTEQARNGLRLIFEHYSSWVGKLGLGNETEHSPAPD